jgi:hypothetical protein
VSRNEQWLVLGGAMLLMAFCIFVMDGMTSSSSPGRSQPSAAVSGDRAGARTSSDGSLASSAEQRLAERRRRSATEVEEAARSDALASRGVYAFARTEGPGSSEATVADASYRNGDPSFGRAGQEFDPRDLAVLDAIIRLNGLTEDSSGMDYDDGDGVLEPTELGNQTWCGSRLRGLQMGPSSSATFGYSVRELPETIANLDFLVVLESNATGLQALPQQLGELQDLERVSAFGNRLTEIPPELADAARLEEIQVGGNAISQIPTSLQQKPGLERLFVAGNPIREMPRMLVKQSEKIMQGQLEVPPRELGRFGPDCRPLS